MSQRDRQSRDCLSICFTWQQVQAGEVEIVDYH